MKRGVCWLIGGLLLGCGARGGARSTPTTVTVVAPPSKASAPSPTPAALDPQARIDAAASLYDAHPVAALGELLPWLCAQATPTKAPELEGCARGTSVNAVGWYLVGKLARRGAFRAGDAEDLNLSAVAWNRVIDGLSAAGKGRVYFNAVDELASVERRRYHYAESMRVYLVLVAELDAYVRDVDPSFMSQVGAMRSLALTEAALLVSDERDWDRDATYDAVSGLDRPEVIKLLAALEHGERVDLYAALVETASGKASSRLLAHRDCALCRRAFDRLRQEAPQDPRLGPLTQVVAACK